MAISMSSICSKSLSISAMDPTFYSLLFTFYFLLSIFYFLHHPDLEHLPRAVLRKRREREAVPFAVPRRRGIDPQIAARITRAVEILGLDERAVRPPHNRIVHRRARRRAVDDPSAVARERGVPFRIAEHLGAADRLDNLLLQRVVHDELVFNSADHPRFEIPLGMAADEDALLDQLGPVGLHRHRHVDAALRVVEVRAHEEENAVAFAIPERVVQKERAVV